MTQGSQQTQQDKQYQKIVIDRAKALRKSMSNADNLKHLVPTPRRRRRRDSLFEVKTKIHDFVRGTLHHRVHRYDVRAADRAAIAEEEKLLRSFHEAAVAVDPATCRQNPNGKPHLPLRQLPKRQGCPKLTDNDVFLALQSN